MWPMTKHITTHIYVYTVSYTYTNTCILYKYIKSTALEVQWQKHVASPRLELTCSISGRLLRVTISLGPLKRVWDTSVKSVGVSEAAWMEKAG